jgi:predicted nucleotide-binding protein
LDGSTYFVTVPIDKSIISWYNMLLRYWGCEKMKRIFISYSHADKVWKDRLVKHLRVLEREGFCHLWHDRKIGLGNDWDPEIENALNKADVAVLVISPDFLDSDFTREKEIPRIRERW